MNVTVLAGGLLSICGIYLSLCERAAGKSRQADDAELERQPDPRIRISRAAMFHGLTFCGLAMLGLSHAATDELTRPSPLVSGSRGSIFFFGAVLTLAGAIGIVFAPTARLVVLSVAVLGAGSATVLGVAGNVIAGAIALAGAAVCGWWLHRQTRRLLSGGTAGNGLSTNESTISRSLDDGQRSTPEPLLTSVAVVLFCWILGATLQSAVVTEAEPKSGMSSSSRALPRASYKAASTHAGNSTSDRPEVGPTIAASSSRSLDDSLFWCAVGLLVATVGLGYSRSAGVQASNSVRDENQTV
ncbi:MAG: hypothetical protein O3B86_04455 [Planctomycetota bacterium]|nr:hypothetical protein [Planctomycetota bacterium]